MIAKGTIFVSYQSESKRLNGEKNFHFRCLVKFMKQNSSSIKHNSVDNNNNNNRFPIDDYSEDNTDTNNELVISITKIEKVQKIYSSIDSSTVFGNTECNAEITNKKELNDRDIVFDSNLKSRKIKYNYKELVGITSIYHLVCW